MKSQEARIAKLEQGQEGDLVVWVVGCRQWDWTPEELEAARVRAQEQADAAGGNNLVVTFEYTKHWRTDNESEKAS